MRGAQLTRRALFGALGAALPLALRVPAALAGEEWCSSEPPVHLWVNGQPFTVNTFVSVPRAYKQLLSTVQVGGSVQGSSVTIQVVGPDSPFTVRSLIQSLGLMAGSAGTIYSPGTTVQLTFPNVYRWHGGGGPAS